MVLLNMGVMTSSTPSPSAKLLTKGSDPKALHERRDAVRHWMQSIRSMADGVLQSRFSELAQAFVHVVRAVYNSPDSWRVLEGILIDELTERAVKRHQAAEEWDD